MNPISSFFPFKIRLATPHPGRAPSIKVATKVAVKAAAPVLTKGAGGGTAPLAVEITSAEVNTVLVYSTHSTASVDPSCAVYESGNMSNMGLTATAGAKPTNVAAVTLAVLGEATVKAMACPTDANYLDPSNVLVAKVDVTSPTATGGVGAPAEVSVTLALGGISVADMNLHATQEKVRRAVAQSLQRDGGRNQKTENVFIRGVRAATGLQAARRRLLVHDVMGNKGVGNGDGADVDEDTDEEVSTRHVLGTADETVRGMFRRRQLLADGVYVDLVLSVEPTAALAAATGLTTITSSTSLKDFLALESIRVSVAVAVPPAIVYSPDDTKNCTLGVSAPSECSLSPSRVHGGCPAPPPGDSGTCTVEVKNGTSGSASVASAAEGRCGRWTNYTVTATAGAYGSCAYAAAKASTSGTRATAAVGSLVAAVWEACEAVWCLSPPSPPPPNAPPPPEPPWYEQAALMGGVFGSLGGIAVICGVVYGVRLRQRRLDRQGMMLDKYALDTVDPTVLRELGVEEGNAQAQADAEEIFIIDPGMRL